MDEFGRAESFTHPIAPYGARDVVQGRSILPLAKQGGVPLAHLNIEHQRTASRAA